MKIKITKKRKGSHADRIFDRINVIIMLFLLIIFVWPLWFILIASISNPAQVYAGNLVLLPKELTLLAYETLLEYQTIWMGYANTIFYSVVGTAINLLMTILCAYPLSRKDFLPRRILLGLFMFTMYFSGGLIPSYLVVKQTGLLDTRWAMIIPGAISVYNMLVMRSYFINSIPEALQEAATLDGANTAQYLWNIILPLSKPVIAVVGLYYFVGHWNDFYTALIYLYDEKLLPLQSFLRNLLMTSKLMNEGILSGMSATEIEARAQLEQTLKYAVIIASAIPVLCIYPFIQRFFVKGVMIGSVKG